MTTTGLDWKLAMTDVTLSVMRSGKLSAIDIGND